MNGSRFSCRSRRCGGRRSAAPPSRYCQVDGCGADLTDAKDYHRRHKVCVLHSKAARALVASLEQRFCQQCSRFHVLSEFDEGKRSCRKRLAGHNERRRKPQSNLLLLKTPSPPHQDDMLLEPVLTGAFVHHSRILNMPTLWRNDELKFLCGKCTWSKAGKVDDGSACECTLQDPIMERSSEQNRERYPFMLLDGSKGILPMSYERSGGQYLQSFTGSLDPGLLLSSSTGLISQSLYGHHSGPGLYSCVSAAPAAETVTIASDYRRALSLLLPQQSVLLPQDVTTQCNQRMLEQVTSEDDDPTIIGQVPEALHPEYLNFSSEKLFLNTSQSRSWAPTFGLTADVLDSIVKQHF